MADLKVKLLARFEAGELTLLDPKTLAPSTLPLEASLPDGVLYPVATLRPVLKSLGVGLRLIPHGTGPELWTIEHAAAAVAAQEAWHTGARDTLRGQMLQAATDSALTVRHPHTGTPYRPANVTVYYELVTPADVNAWLARDPSNSLRWRLSTGKPAPTSVDFTEETAATPGKASQAAEREARQDARLAHCEERGLVFDKDPLRPLPYGIAKAAASLVPPISRQSLSTDVKAALYRRRDRQKNGKG